MLGSRVSPMCRTGPPTRAQPIVATHNPGGGGRAKIGVTTVGALEMNPSILVIDDNPDHLELTVMALGECCDPRVVVTCWVGVVALVYLFGGGVHDGRDTSQQPRLIILDMKLVRMHGLDVLKAERQAPRTAPLP